MKKPQSSAPETTELAQTIEILSSVPTREEIVESLEEAIQMDLNSDDMQPDVFRAMRNLAAAIKIVKGVTA